MKCGNLTMIRVLRCRTGAALSELKGHKAPVLRLAVHGRGRAVSAGRDGLICVWDIQRGAQMGRLRGHKGHVTSVRWLEELGAGALFASGAQDGHVRVWDLRARREVANVDVHTTPEGAGAVSELQVRGTLIHVGCWVFRRSHEGSPSIADVDSWCGWTG